MPHRDRERWKLRLDIDTGAIPTEKGVDRIGVSQIVRAWDTPIRCADIGDPEEVVHCYPDGRARVGCEPSVIAHEQRSVDAVWQAPARAKVALHLDRCTRGQRDNPRLVEL